MLLEAKGDLTDGIYIRFSEQMEACSTFGVSLPARRPLSLCLELTTELLFADDCALLGYTEEALQHIVNRFSDAAKNFGLTISLKKTEVLYQPLPREAYCPRHISINGTNLNALENFTFVGSVIFSDATVRKDLDNRLSEASCSFGRLSKTVWQSHSLRFSMKIQVCRAVAIPSLMYGAETWVLYRKHIRLIESFHQR